MAKVIGFDPKIIKTFTCRHCGAIVEYEPREDKWTNEKCDDTNIRGLACPNCGEFHRTNP